MREIEQLRCILEIREQEYSAAAEAKNISLAARVLHQRDIAYLDLMDCILEQKQFAWHKEPDWSSAWYDTSAELQ
jgi:hypothetical protein